MKTAKSEDMTFIIYYLYTYHICIYYLYDYLYCIIIYIYIYIVLYIYELWACIRISYVYYPSARPAPEHITYRTKLTELHDLGHSRSLKIGRKPKREQSSSNHPCSVGELLASGNFINSSDINFFLLQFRTVKAGTAWQHTRHGCAGLFSAPERMVRSTAHITTSRALMKEPTLRSLNDWLVTCSTPLICRDIFKFKGTVGSLCHI